jgi:hypothetical protein
MDNVLLFKAYYENGEQVIVAKLSYFGLNSYAKANESDCEKSSIDSKDDKK